MKPEVVAFLDTNYCLHYKLPKFTEWTKILDAERVRLMVCMQVVHELDMGKGALDACPLEVVLEVMPPLQVRRVQR